MASHAPTAVDCTGCPLCGARDAQWYLTVPSRRYLRCADCDLVFVHAQDRPTPSEAASRYLEHENSRDDAGYVAFLQRLAEPLCARVPTGARGLDAGCGPVPVLAELLTASGRPTLHYDPLFYPDRDALAARYDFVTCTEVVEHAHDPAALVRELFALVRPGGLVGVTTSLLSADIDFERWWYRRDVTHVNFFSACTMRWIAAHSCAQVDFPSTNVMIFTSPNGESTHVSRTVSLPS